MVKPAARGQAVERAVERHGLSQRRACGLVGIGPSTYHYRSRRDPCDELRRRLRSLTAKRPRWGYRRLHVLVDREGWHVNHKKLYRLYRDEGLAGRRKRRKRVAALPRRAIPLPERPNQRRSMDFVHDTLANGRAFRALNIVDDCSREDRLVGPARGILGDHGSRARFR